MEELKKYSTAQLREELCSREDDVIVGLETDTPYGCLIRGKASSVRIPKGYLIIAVKKDENCK